MRGIQRMEATMAVEESRVQESRAKKKGKQCRHPDQVRAFSSVL